jgi:DNA-binding transcriptional LysR family regulator
VSAPDRQLLVGKRAEGVAGPIAITEAPPQIAWSGAVRDLDLRAIRCLVVLSEEQHYGRACERLHVSQPGLSRTISILEGRIGATLIERSMRPIRLTPAGEVLVSHGRRLLAQQREAFDRLAAVLLGGRR